MILEHSFHTNTAIAAWLLDENHLERLARAQAAAIALYYNLSAPEEEKKSGWYQEEGGWRYYLGNTGEPVRNDWHKSGDDWYWFDGAGFMVYNDWKRGSDGTWYYLKENGAMARNEWIIWKKELYRVLEDGAMFIGCMCLESGEDGALKTGFGGLSRMESKEAEGTLLPEKREKKKRRPRRRRRGKKAARKEKIENFLKL